MKSENLATLFDSKIFRIPDFQRGYAWGEKQLLEFWDDIEEISIDAYNKMNPHYMGTIFLESIQPEVDWISNASFYNIIDGQQRLTTIMLCIFEILKVEEDGYCEFKIYDLRRKYVRTTNRTGFTKVYNFKYADGDKNCYYLLSKIFEDTSYDPYITTKDLDNVYRKNLRTAKKFFADKVKDLDHNNREFLFKKITLALQFDIREIEKDLDVQAVFETMNNRGKPLSTLEKLKNRLIYLTEKLNGESIDKKTLREAINEAWGKIYMALGQNPNEILDEDVFLAAHLSLYRKPKESTFSEVMSSKKIFEMFCSKSEQYALNDDSNEMEGKVSFAKIEDYIKKLSDLAPIWYEIHNTDSKEIKKILVLNSTQDIKIFLGAVMYKFSEAEKKADIISMLEKILFRNKIEGIGVVDNGTLANLARDIYNDLSNIDSVIENFKGLINTAINSEIVVKFFSRLFDFERGKKGFHRWSTLKYFIFEYEEYLKSELKESYDKLSIFNFDETTIEHIIPQGYEENWNTAVETIIQKISSEKHEQAKKVLINSLGNLTILKDGKNSSLGNKSWDIKKSRFKTGSLNEIEISKKSIWSDIEIAMRGAKMMTFLESKVEGLKLSYEEKGKSLFSEDLAIHEMINKEVVADLFINPIKESI